MHCSLTVLALILLCGGHCFLVWLPSKVTRDFIHRVRLPTSRNNVLYHITMFPGGVYQCVYRESTEWALELQVMVYTDNLKGGVTRPIRKLNIRVVY